MGNRITLTLGGVAFKDMEIPEDISFGGKQRISIQNLIGGDRVVTTLGLDNGNIKFSGVFSGSDAVSRVQTLDAARATGAQLPLCWDEFFYLVIIEEFSVEYRKTNFIHFSIVCVIVNDPISEIVRDTISATNAVASDLTSASSLTSQSGLISLNLENADQTQLSSAQSQIEAAVSSIDSNLSGINLQINSTEDPDAAVIAIQSMSGNAGQLAALLQMSGFINRASANQDSG